MGQGLAVKTRRVYRATRVWLNLVALEKALCLAVSLRYNTPSTGISHSEANMLGHQIEAVFENGVFRPLRRVNLPTHQPVTLILPPDEEALDEDAGYEPLPLEQRKTIRVRLKHIGDIGPLPYPIEPEDLEQE